MVKRRRKVDSQVVNTIKPGNVTSFDEALKAFIQSSELRGLSDATVTFYRRELDLYRRKMVELDALDIVRVHKIKPQDIELFISAEMDVGKSRNTINSRLRAVRAFYSFCYRKQWLKRNPFDEVKLLKTRHTVGDTFSPSQLKRILDAPDITTFTGLRDYSIMLMFAHTGIRLNELSSLRTHDIDFEDGAINIQHAKNTHARRIPMTKRLHATMSAWVTERGQIPGVNALFITYEDKPLSRRQIQQRVAYYGKRTGLSDDVATSPHTFRRTFAKNKIASGTDVFTVQALMGHSDLSVLKKYVAIYSQDLKNAIENGIE
ncbi:tyrosine-type recombinase/integrase [Halobacillus sp. A5]|uniref:tyrosine-type recombinase/integrase n=1 Tax=Halobacillus sp. A5 TaxID=2880263 RepID=UPI0020A649A6|nr:tyrosine-type recombinase/integrase [Halobacillus sp. A5]MCP3026865.1 tyrosine-type recombinase/integrase [Halobacillus sp. A5]